MYVDSSILWFVPIRGAGVVLDWMAWWVFYKGFLYLWLVATLYMPVWPPLKMGASSLVLRATSHMSQEPWPCNGEDPWLSSKGRTMGVGKAVICSLGPSSIVWSENGPCCWTIAYFVAGKEGRNWFNIICLKLYQFKRILRWCLSIMESILKSVLEYALKFVLLEKISKSW
jgi:hypothetical protein